MTAAAEMCVERRVRDLEDDAFPSARLASRHAETHTPIFSMACCDRMLFGPTRKTTERTYERVPQHQLLHLPVVDAAPVRPRQKLHRSRPRCGRHRA